MMVPLLLAMLAAAPEASVTVDLKRPPAQRVAVTVIEGAEPLAWSGFRLGSGDVNGDGIDDLVIAAPGGSEDRPSRRGRIYVVHGGVEARDRIDLAIRREPHVIPGKPPVLTTAANVVIDGSDDFDHLGRSLAVADLDRDGFADIIAGAPAGDGLFNARPDCGEVVVIHGGTDLPTFIRLDRPSAGLRVSTIYGRKVGDGLGASIATGDVNGDGMPDLVLGAVQADGESGAFDAVDVGAVFLLAGKAGGIDPIVLLAGEPSDGLVVIEGDDPGDQAGAAVAVGDFDGDGLEDVAVGSRGADGEEHRRPDSGEVHLIFGRRDLPPGIALGRDADVVFASAGVGDMAGSSVAFGDVDGDGADDLAIGAPLADGPLGARIDAGGVILVMGRPREKLESLRPPPPQNLSNMTRALQDLERVGGIRGGSAGPADAPAEPPRRPIAVDLAARRIDRVVVLHGLDPGDHAGILGLADLDRDGLDDVIVGAEDSSGHRNRRAGGGEIQVVFGARISGPEWALEAPAGTATIYGPVGGVRVGAAAETVDLDGDSRPELVVAAPQAGRSLEGAIWILRATHGELLRPSPGR